MNENEEENEVKASEEEKPEIKFDFETETDVVKTTLYAVIGAGAGLMVLAVIFGIVAQNIFVFIALGLLVALLTFFCFMLVRTVRWRLSFIGCTLVVTNLKTEQKFRVWKVPKKDFVMKITSAEKNLGSIKILNTVFDFKNVQNFAETKAYIEEHFI